MSDDDVEHQKTKQDIVARRVSTWTRRRQRPWTRRTPADAVRV